jgi:hypothetical protein
MSGGIGVDVHVENDRISTTIRVLHNQTVLLGGGFSGETKGKRNYIFLNARIIREHDLKR